MDIEKAHAFLPPLLELLGDEIHANAVDKGFYPDGPDGRNAGELVALLHEELSETLRAIRDGDPPDKHCPQFRSTEVELADVVIRLLDTAKVWNVRLGEAILAKMAFNKTREHRHGRTF